MKKSLMLLSLSFLGLVSNEGFSQNNSNIKLMPDVASVCKTTTLYLSIPGNSFVPTSYLWSTGATTPTIEITTSGTYTLSVTGFTGGNNRPRTVVLSNAYNVKPQPTINPLTDIWVCKDETVVLEAEAGYDSYQWNNGTAGEIFSKTFTLGGGNTPQLDTMTVNYTSTITGVCSVTSESLVIRGVRKPKGVGQFFCGRTDLNLNDSVPAGLVLEYLYPVRYDMEFTDLSDPTNVIYYVTQPGQLKAPLNILEAGKSYTVRTRPLINTWTFCYGDPCTIGITSSNRLMGESNSMKTYRVMDVSGRVLVEQKAEFFNREWVRNFPSQIFVITETSENGEVNVTREFIQL
ncbi:MAG: hypothetical protein RL090_790 [Bacteroidota bacterium]|jgi:hypothetical protein